MPRGDARVHVLRRFNRFYTRRLGLLHYRGTLKSPFSLTEVRVLYELAHRNGPTATELCDALGLDPGYLSRILAGFARRGMIGRRKSNADGRQTHLSLTRRGKVVFAPLERRQRRAAAAMLDPLSAADQDRLVEAVDTVAALLGGRGAAKPACTLRPHRPGDMG